MTEKLYNVTRFEPSQFEAKFGLNDIVKNFYEVSSGKLIVEPTGQLDRTYVYGLDYINEKIIFSISKFMKYGSGRTQRNHVIVYSCDYNTLPAKVEKHVYYKSISDGNFWRYCTVTDSIYYKGQNYVNSTFINLELQCYLFKQENNFEPVVSTSDSLEDCLNISTNASVELKNRITKTDSSYISQFPFFSVIDESFRHVTIFEDWDRCILEFFVNWKTNLRTIFSGMESANNDRDTKTEYLVALERSQTYGDIAEQFLSNDVFRQIHRYESRSNFFAKVYESLDKVFCKTFTFKSSTRTILMEERNITIERNNIRMKICRIDIESTHGSEYVLYYVVYNIGLSESKIAYLHIIPKNARITKFGLDSRYVSTGAFINKLFDYKRQSPMTHTAGDKLAMTYKDLTFLADFKCNKNILNPTRTY